jgi:hypothetical protein
MTPKSPCSRKWELACASRGAIKGKPTATGEMRDSLDALLDIFHDRGKLRTLRDALERGGRRRCRRNREQKS